MVLVSRSRCDGRGGWLIYLLLLLAIAYANLIAEGQARSSTFLPDPPSAILPRYELGVNVADIRTLCRNGCDYPSWAVGVGGSINRNHNAALISDANVTATSSSISNSIAGGHFAEYLSESEANFAPPITGIFCRVSLASSHRVTQSRFPIFPRLGRSCHIISSTHIAIISSLTLAEA